MPDISATIRTMLTSEATVSAVVSTRVRSDILKENETLPAITYFVVDTVPNETLTAIADVSMARIQIDCFAATRSAANSLADGVRLALQKQGRQVVGSQHITDITLPSGERHSVDRAESGSDIRRFVTSQDFNVWYKTTTS